MNLTTKNSWFIISIVLFLSACKEELDNTESDTWLHDFYVDVNFNETDYALKKNNYQFEIGEEIVSCADSYVYGIRHTQMTAHDERKSAINYLSFGIAKKVARIDMQPFREVEPGTYVGSPIDSLTYINKVLSNRQRGASEVGFPRYSVGYEPVMDYNIDPWAEAYLSFSTQDGKFYRSSLPGNGEVANTSYIDITSILNLGENAPKEYTYIVEGTFQVNMFNAESSTDSVALTGNFRLPIYNVYTEELQALCANEF